MDARSIPLIRPTGHLPVLTPEHVIAYAKQKGAQRIPELQKMVDVWFQPWHRYNPDVLSAMSDLETDSWRSLQWVSNLNPGGIGVTDDFDFNHSWENGTDAGYGMLVHFMAYAAGHDNALASYIRLDPRFVVVHMVGYAGIAKTLSGLSGRWATDTLYADKVAGRMVVMSAALNPPNDGNDWEIPDGIVFVGTGNWHHRNPGARISHVFHHITDDPSFTRVKSWFQNPDSNASSHFVIDKDGTIYQFVSTSNAAWTNGAIRSPRTDIPLLFNNLRQSKGYGGSINFNDFCVSIEYVCGRSEIPTDAQYKSGIIIADYVCGRYGVSRHRNGQCRHSDVDSVDRSYCPGPRFDLARIIRGIGGDPERMR